MGDSAGAAAGSAAAALNVVEVLSDGDVAEMATFLVSITALMLAATDIQHLDEGKEVRWKTAAIRACQGLVAGGRDDRLRRAYSTAFPSDAGELARLRACAASLSTNASFLSARTAIGVALRLATSPEAAAGVLSKSPLKALFGRWQSVVHAEPQTVDDVIRARVITPPPPLSPCAALLHCIKQYTDEGTLGHSMEQLYKAGSLIRRPGDDSAIAAFSKLEGMHDPLVQFCFPSSAAAEGGVSSALRAFDDGVLALRSEFLESCLSSAKSAAGTGSSAVAAPVSASAFSDAFYKDSIRWEPQLIRFSTAASSSAASATLDSLFRALEVYFFSGAAPGVAGGAGAASSSDAAPVASPLSAGQRSQVVMALARLLVGKGVFDGTMAEALCARIAPPQPAPSSGGSASAPAPASAADPSVVRATAARECLAAFSPLHAHLAGAFLHRLTSAAASLTRSCGDILLEGLPVTAQKSVPVQAASEGAMQALDDANEAEVEAAEEEDGGGENSTDADAGDSLP